MFKGKSVSLENLAKTFEEAFSHQATVRPVILDVGSVTMNNVALQNDQLKIECNKALDILDWLSKSGALVLDQCSIHVFVGVNHDFQKSLMDSIVQENRNPIAEMHETLVKTAQLCHGKRLLVKRDLP